MEAYYSLEHLLKFKEIGKDSPELAKKFFEYYDAVFSAGDFTENA